MEKWTRSFVRSLDRLHHRVQSLLEEGETDPQQRAAFEPSRDERVIEALSVGLPADELDRAVIAFNRLAGLFDAGVLLEKRDDGWAPLASFRDGIAKPMRMDAALALPAVKPLQVLRAPAAPLLERLKLSDLDPRGNADALLIKPTPDYSFVLLSSLPDLWLKDHTARVLKSLTAGFAS